MFRIPGVIGKDLCDTHLGSTRRDILRVGGAGIMGLTLNNILRGQAMASKEWGQIIDARRTFVFVKVFFAEICRRAEIHSGVKYITPTHCKENVA